VGGSSEEGRAVRLSEAKRVGEQAHGGWPWIGAGTTL